MRTLLQERRRFPRTDIPAHVAISLLQPHPGTAPYSVNISEGGLCLQLQELLEVRSLVRFQLTHEKTRLSRGRPVECTGRVAWVVQRLDLRDSPPFLFDVGIEFVDPPPMLRQLLAQRGGRAEPTMDRGVRLRAIDPVTIRGRSYLPRLQREMNHTPLSWHLVVVIDGTPCFSGHYGSERSAIAAWTKFKRQQARRPAASRG